MSYPLMRGLWEWAESRGQVEHAGLLLDRYVPFPRFDSFDQKEQSKHIDRITGAASPPIAEAILERWEALAKALPHAERWTQKTVWRLAAHLSRASVLENGACCLHPLYGFAYLPGSGLKGLARAQAVSELGREEHPDVCRIFGKQEHGGSVVFLEAWPVKWLCLEKDIVNNHHKDYYAHQGTGHPPGDWENPNPTYSLAVKPGVTFRFCVAARDAWAENAQEDVKRAAGWLKAGLAELGAGAKTAAGYGYFEPCVSDGNHPTSSIDSKDRSAARSEPEDVSGGNNPSSVIDMAAIRERDAILKQIEGLRKPNDIGSVPGLLQKIGRLQVAEHRKECAKMLQRQLSRSALQTVWANKRHAKSREILESLLA